jgi:hypothetical protein
VHGLRLRAGCDLVGAEMRFGAVVSMCDRSVGAASPAGRAGSVVVRTCTYEIFRVGLAVWNTPPQELSRFDGGRGAIV